MLIRCILALLLGCSTAVWAQDFFEIVDIEESPEPEPEDSALKFRGHIQQELKYGLHAPDSNFAFDRDSKGLSQMRTEIFLEGKYTFTPNVSIQVSAKSEIDWLQWQQGEQEWKLEKYDNRLKDAFIDYTFADTWWLRAGNQVFAWGEAESLSITDILSTRDIREPGQAELEDIRESIPALSLTKSFNSRRLLSSLNLAVSYKAGIDLYAEEHEDFYPNIAFKSLIPSEQFHLSDPEKKWEAAVRYSLQVAGGDYSVVAGEINNNTPEVLRTNSDNEVFLFQRRQQAYGLSANKAIGEFILRGEFALYKDQDLPENTDPALSKETQQRLMAGVEYAGISNWIFSVEFNQLQSKMEHLSDSNRDSGFTLRVQNSAFNEKLTSQLWLIKLADMGGEVARINLSYKPVDNWEFLAAYILYANDKPESTLYPFRKNDTINLALKYGF